MKPEQLPQVFAANLVAARHRAGLSQRDLALRIGTSYPQLCRWETGVNSPTLHSIVKIANGLGVPPELLLSEVGLELMEKVPA